MATWQRQFDIQAGTSSVGRSAVHFICPFCGAAVTAYRWSLAGSGKRCACGAKFDAYGRATKVED